MTLILISLSIVVVILSCWYYYKKSFLYWKNLNVHYLEPSIPFGNIKGIFRKLPIYVEFKDYYDYMKKRGHKYAGLYIFTKPFFMVIDPELIKRIMIKDFEYFANHGLYCNPEDDPLSAHMLAAENEHWKTLRMKMSPTFTTGKLKILLSSLNECGNKLKNYIYSQPKTINTDTLFSNYIIDVIATCAFGVECNSYSDENSEFIKYGKLSFEDYNISTKFGFLVLFPKLSLKLGLKMVNEEVSKFFLRLVSETVINRDKLNIRKADFLQILMDLRGTEHELTTEEMAAQVYMFFFAAFESSIITGTHLLHELSLNEEIQNDVRTEIEQCLTKHKGQLTYQCLNDMVYTQQVLEENIRKNPAVPFLFRECSKNYTIPGTSTIIEKSTTVIIPTYAIHYDPKFYPNPEKFDPNRFSKENKLKMVRYTFLTFGEGPRNCIATRFAYMIMKVALVACIRNNKVELSEKTPRKLTYKAMKLALVLNETVEVNFIRL